MQNAWTVECVWRPRLWCFKRSHQELEADWFFWCMFALVGVYPSWTSRMLSYWCLSVNVSWWAFLRGGNLKNRSLEWIAFGFWIVCFLGSVMVQLDSLTSWRSTCKPWSLRTRPCCLVSFDTALDNWCCAPTWMIWSYVEKSLIFFGSWRRWNKHFTVSGGEVLPVPDQNPHDAVRFLKKRHYFTQHGVIVAAHEKYVEELVEL